MAEEHPTGSIAELFSDVLTQTTSLFRTEIRLAKTELSEKLTETVRSSGMVIAGTILLIGALYLFLLWLVRLLVVFGVPEHWATLLVAIAAGVVGFFVMRSGLARLSPSTLVPDRTVQSLEKDALMAKETAR